MSSLTRRKFLKRSGGATVATVIALNMAVERALGDGAHTNSSCSAKVAADPNDADYWTDALDWGVSWNKTLRVQASCICNPAGAPSRWKSILMHVRGSGGNEGMVWTSDIVISGGIDKWTCEFEAGFWQNGILSDDGGPDTYTVLMPTVWEDNLDSSGSGTKELIEYYATLEVTETKKTTHDAYMKAKIYIKRETEIRTYVSHGLTGTTPGPTTWSPGTVLQNLWLWKV